MNRQDAGERLRAQLGIDGTAGDAQDVWHPYTIATTDPPDAPCLVCGLAEPHRRHVERREIRGFARTSAKAGESVDFELIDAPNA